MIYPRTSEIVNQPHVAGIAELDANATLDVSHDMVRVTGGTDGITITLPTAVGHLGRRYHIKKVDDGVGAVTVDTTESETIDGASSVSLASQYQSVKVISNGTNWDIDGAYEPPA